MCTGCEVEGRRMLVKSCFLFYFEFSVKSNGMNMCIQYGSIRGEDFLIFRGISSEDYFVSSTWFVSTYDAILL